jgi:hypothetical protein
MYLFKFPYVELIFYSVPTSTKKSLALVGTELKARNKSGMYITCVFYAARKYQASTTVLVPSAKHEALRTVVLVLVLALKLNTTTEVED